MVTGALLVHIQISLNHTGAKLTYIQVDEEEQSMNYSQTFQLLPDGSGSFFIFNDIFKLVFG